MRPDNGKIVVRGSGRTPFDDNLRLRNDDVEVGKMRFQDLLKNDVSRLLLGVLRLAGQPKGLGDVWLETAALLRQVRGAAGDDTAIRHVHDELTQLANKARAWLNDNSAGAVVR